MSAKKDDVDELVKQFKGARDEDSDSDPEREISVKPWVDWFGFNLSIGGVITLNAFTMGLETDARGEALVIIDGKQEAGNVSGIWYLIELVFCVIFAGELFARLYYHRFAFFTNPHNKMWNIGDFIIVMISLADTFVMTPVGMGGGGRLISMLRFIRLMRLIRLIRLMRLFKELWLVASGLFESSKTLCWIALMLVSFIYICAIFLTLAIGKNDKLYDQYFLDSGGWDHEVYFRSVTRSMFTLFQIVTFESWNERLVRHVVHNQPAMVIFFVVFIALTSFGLLNIVVGVICERTINTSEADENKMKRAQERDRQRVFDHLREIFETADEDGSGTLTLQEVRKAIDKPEIATKLKMIEFPVEDPKQIFTLLDFNNCGELSIDDFIAGCIRMKGTAKSKDLLAAQVAVDTMKRHFTYFEAELGKLKEKVSLLDDTARALVYQGEHVFLNLQEYRRRHPELDGGMASAPPVQTEKINTSPWEMLPGAKEARVKAEQFQLALKSGTASQKQEALYAQAFNQPGTQIELYADSPSAHQLDIYQGNDSPSGGERCQQCGEPFDEHSRKFCTKCGTPKPTTIGRNDQLAFRVPCSSLKNPPPFLLRAVFLKRQLVCGSHHSCHC